MTSQGGLSGKTVIVTGGNSGLGFESVKTLSADGARVVMASRTLSKAEAAREQILERCPGAKIDLMPLDLASLESVQDFAERFTAQYDRLDVLMNNAGVMALPRQQTADGFEMQFGTNHLGHFALTGMLLPQLLATAKSRIVIVTSLAAVYGSIRFDDLMHAQGYSRWTVYCQSKLANMLFGLELNRRLQAADADTICVLAHPGFSSTNLQKGPTVAGGLFGSLTEKSIRLMCQSQARGALPQIYAATQADVHGGDYIAPDGLGQMKGEPAKIRIPRSGRSAEDAKRLWDVSVQLTGTVYTGLTPSPANHADRVPG